jgi:hypothetical protein
MKNLILLFSALIIITTISSCKKDDDHDHNDAVPEITFIEPVDQQEYSLTDTVRIRASITHTDAMHKYMLIVENLISNVKDTMINTHEHDMNISIDTSFFPNVADHTHFQIRVIAADHNEMTNDKVITIHVE